MSRRLPFADSLALCVKHICGVTWNASILLQACFMFPETSVQFRFFSTLSIICFFHFPRFSFCTSMNQLKLFQVLDKSTKRKIFCLFSAPKYICSVLNMISVLIIWIVFPEKIPRVPVYCFSIWASNTEKAIRKHFFWNKLCRLYNLWSRTRLKNKRYLIFSILKIIFLQNHRIDFFHEGHKRQFATYGRSFVI